MYNQYPTFYTIEITVNHFLKDSIINALQEKMIECATDMKDHVETIFQEGSITAGAHESYSQFAELRDEIIDQIREQDVEHQSTIK